MPPREEIEHARPTAGISSVTFHAMLVTVIYVNLGYQQYLIALKKWKSLWRTSPLPYCNPQTGGLWDEGSSNLCMKQLMTQPYIGASIYFMLGLCISYIKKVIKDLLKIQGNA